ncbi:hypothetical protein BDU57DRAFT_173754 [Ampelomyces quisqualis]|uniref:Uncharacterized protein n=1 Tax=Ampelomyces quisqualis TaxID=50730 RepID=A0A6A5QQM3_AMPQU|nr:hypothetical protein BDU57DRAFT_173754 [Ampelomyces quisqualis]
MGLGAPLLICAASIHPPVNTNPAIHLSHRQLTTVKGSVLDCAVEVAAGWACMQIQGAKLLRLASFPPCPRAQQRLGTSHEIQFALENTTHTQGYNVRPKLAHVQQRSTEARFRNYHRAEVVLCMLHVHRNSASATSAPSIVASKTLT